MFDLWHADPRSDLRHILIITDDLVSCARYTGLGNETGKK